VGRVVAVGAVDDDAVGLAVAGGAAEGVGEVDVDACDVGAGEVVDGELVGLAEGVVVDVFDAVGVHGDVAGVAEEGEVVAVGGEGDRKSGGEGEGVHGGVGVLAFDRVAAVAGVPGEPVVAGAEEGGVVAAVAVGRVVAVHTE